MRDNGGCAGAASLPPLPEAQLPGCPSPDCPNTDRASLSYPTTDSRVPTSLTAGQAAPEAIEIP